NRIHYLKLAQKKLGCTVLLKGSHTLVCDGDKIIEIQTGNAALAKAGTGDVLTGMIAGFMAQGVQPLNAAVLAATLHGAMADSWVKSKRDQGGLMASDLLTMLPETIFKFRKYAKF
ncbi:MAG: NAD(P)H-hydrate dehydratase, partial [Candidatus Paceibacterales bacterium]